MLEAIQTEASEHIVVTADARILNIVINRPARKNAMTGEMYASVAAALRDSAVRDDIDVVLVRGQPAAFCAGNDITDFVAKPPVHADAPVWEFFRALMELDKPVVAAVDGPAIGIGTTMLLHCDLVFASDRSVFALPFTSLGLTPEGASTVLLPLLAGRQRAAEMLLLGTKVTAEQACGLGLVNQVVPAEALLGTAQSCAQKLASLPPGIVRATKRLTSDGLSRVVSHQFAAELDVFRHAVVGPAAAQAFAKFLGKAARP